MTKSILLPIGNGLVLGVAFTSHLEIIKGVAGLALILVTLAFTTYQALLARQKYRRTQKLYNLISSAQLGCGRAAAGQCPLSDVLKEVEEKKL